MQCIIKNPEKYDTEDLLKVIRRMLTLSSIEYYTNKCNKLILDVVCRYLYSKKLGNYKLALAIKVFLFLQLFGDFAYQKF